MYKNDLIVWDFSYKTEFKTVSNRFDTCFLSITLWTVIWKISYLGYIGLSVQNEEKVSTSWFTNDLEKTI